HPIFAALIGDYPQQCLITGTINGDCPSALVSTMSLANTHPSQHELCDLDAKPFM
ncbi:hypothetical protein C8R48DRAFT_611675, partial [Suillus tomentosus]